MTEVVLQRTSIVAIVRKLVSAGVPEHEWPTTPGTVLGIIAEDICHRTR